MNLADPDCPSCRYADSNSDSNSETPLPAPCEGAYCLHPAECCRVLMGTTRSTLSSNSVSRRQGPDSATDHHGRKQLRAKNSFLGEENTSPNLFRPE